MFECSCSMASFHNPAMSCNEIAKRQMREDWNIMHTHHTHTHFIPLKKELMLQMTTLDISTISTRFFIFLSITFRYCYILQIASVYQFQFSFDRSAQQQQIHICISVPAGGKHGACLILHSRFNRNIFYNIYYFYW